MKRTLILGLLACTSCHRAQPDGEPPGPTIHGDTVAFPPASAQTAMLGAEPVEAPREGRVTLTGRLVWDENRTSRVFAPVSGRVIAIAVDLGRTVRAGERLATLASPDFGQAQADAARAAADLGAAERTLVRLRALCDIGAAARKELEQAQSDRDRAAAEQRRTQARLELWGGGGAPGGTVDQEFWLKSPVGGRIVERNLNPGQEVRSDATTPLFVVSDPGRLWVLLDLGERDLAEIEEGSPLHLHSPAYPDRAFDGRLEKLGDSLDPTTRTLRARGSVDNPDGLLKAEMYVTVDLHARRRSAQLSVPAGAVIRDAARSFVFVEEGPGLYRRLPVALGPEKEGRVGVASGLSGRERVVTGGALLLEATWAASSRS